MPTKRAEVVLPLLLIAVLSVVIGATAYSKFIEAPNPNGPPSRVLRPPTTAMPMAGVASVIDGDTIEIHGTRIRLFGIDAPESGQACTIEGRAWPCGRRAAFALADKIRGQSVECRQKDRDRFDRVVAVCRADGEDINGWMVYQGWAVAYRRYSLDYVNQERQAANAKRGMWQGEFDAPEEWRRNHTQRLNPAPPPPSKPKFVTPP
jgi:endonuclease YncB( thermonuclease family)